MAITRYRAASAAPFAAAAGTAPFFVIEGSATKVVRIKRISIEGPTLTLVQYLDLIVKKNSTAASGGTATALTKVPIDSGFAAGTANTVNTYTAAPTAGTAVGVIDAGRMLGQATTPAAAGLPQQNTLFDLVAPNTSIVLRGVAEGLSLHFANAPASAVTLSVEVEWEEE